MHSSGRYSPRVSQGEHARDAVDEVQAQVVALLLPTAIFAGYFAIEIETPKTPTKVGTYDIAFFAVNTEKKIVKVECFEDGVSFQTLDNVNSVDRKSVV